MNWNHIFRAVSALAFTTLMVSCGDSPTGSSGGSSSSTTGQGSDSTSGSGTLPLDAFYNVANIYVDGDEIVIETTDVPDHGSPYFVDANGTPVTGWETYTGSNAQFHQNFNRISAKTITFRIPLNPSPATVTQTTPLGAMGVAVNGVLIFNQYAAGFSPLGLMEINSFDQYNGHPTGQNQYHYHIEPLYLTDTLGVDALIGVLMDGYPVYGPMENGVTLTGGDLDAFHGHTGPTPEYPEGTYHYHVTADTPYINGDGFYGVPGTVTNN